MTDTVIKGAGNSRSIRSVPNLAALAPTWEKALEMLTSEEGLPIDLGPLNEAGIARRGDDLNKANLLKDATAALYGKSATAVPDDIFAAIRPLIQTAQNSGLHIQTGSYVGTGATSGSRTIYFSGIDPYLVLLSSDRIYDVMTYAFFGIRPQVTATAFYYGARGSGGTNTTTITWGSNSISMYAVDGHMEQSGLTYYWAVIGAKT